MKNSDYQLISRNHVYKGKKVNVFDETIKLPNGNIVEWDMVDFPDIYMAIPVTEDNNVLMVKQWRQGPKTIMTDFVGARKIYPDVDGLEDLKRELREELGLVSGDYEFILQCSNGVRISGSRFIYLVKNFEIEQNELDENEILEKIKLPLKGLFLNLKENHITSSETLLMAKLVEEKCEM